MYKSILTLTSSLIYKDNVTMRAEKLLFFLKMPDAPVIFEIYRENAGCAGNNKNVSIKCRKFRCKTTQMRTLAVRW